MPAAEILSHLVAATPFLMRGFAMNVLVSAVAMAIGTVVGWGLALLRLSAPSQRARYAERATEFLRSMPTIVFQFYLVFILPTSIPLPFGGGDWVFPVWLKASLALSVAVVGFTSDNLTIALRDWQRGQRSAAFLFICSWTSYLLIIVMASSTASIVGVGELVSHCNTIVNASGGTALMLPVYLYACAIFFCFCFPLTLLMGQVSRQLALRLDPDPAAS
jgi:polar amino acid transport system permease protein